MNRKKLIQWGARMVAVTLFVSGSASSYSYVMETSNYVVDEARTRAEIFIMAKTQLGVDGIDNKIIEAINDNDIELAESYYVLSKDLKFKLKPKTEEKYEASRSTWEQAKRISNDMASGIFTGEMKGIYGTAGAIGVEFVPFVADLRDLAIEGKNYLDSGEMDKTTIGLATVGLAIDAPSIMTFGTSLVATTSANIGVAVIKLANKNKKLTKEFSAVLIEILEKTINFEKLSLFIKPKNSKNWLLSNYGKAKGTFSSTKKNVRATFNSKYKPFKDIVADTSKITEATSISATIKLFKFVDRVSDLKELKAISKIFGKKTLAIMYAFGKPVFKLIKTAIKITSELILSITTAVLGAIFIFLHFFYLRRAFRG